jgi:hypothetical protein
MSTRSAIIIQTEDGFEGVYCHSDGYPAGVGRTLLDHYQDRDKVRRLVALGDLSYLEERVEPDGSRPHSFDAPQSGVTVAYGRDRGEDGVKTKGGATLAEVEDRIGHDGHVYVYCLNGHWDHNGILLARAVAADEWAVSGAEEG